MDCLYGLQMEEECLSVKGLFPACQWEVRHIQFDLGMTLT